MDAKAFVLAVVSVVAIAIIFMVAINSIFVLNAENLRQATRLMSMYSWAKSFLYSLSILLPIVLALAALQIFWFPPKIDAVVTACDVVTGLDDEMERFDHSRPVLKFVREKFPTVKDNASIVYPLIAPKIVTSPASRPEPRTRWYRLPGELSSYNYETFLKEAPFGNLNALYSDFTTGPGLYPTAGILTENPFETCTSTEGSKPYYPPLSTTNYLTRITLRNHGRNPVSNVIVMVPGKPVVPLIAPWDIGVTENGIFSVLRIPFLPGYPMTRTLVIDSWQDRVYEEDVQIEAPVSRELNETMLIFLFSVSILFAALYATWK